jgi:CRP/FNR family transcriptional regulator, cyclic AMP receptor protein
MSANSPFWQNFFRSKSLEDQMVDTLEKLPLFSALSHRKLKQISSWVADSVYRPDTFNQSDLIFEQGQEGSGMYVLLSGQVNIYLDYHIDDSNLLATLNPGDFFGEINLLDEMPRSATAVAAEKSEVLFFHGREFREALKTNVEIGYEVMRALAEVLGKRLRETDELLRRKDVELRLLREKLKNSESA